MGFQAERPQGIQIAPNSPESHLPEMLRRADDVPSRIEFRCGLLVAVKDILATAEHRRCLRRRVKGIAPASLITIASTPDAHSDGQVAIQPLGLSPASLIPDRRSGAPRPHYAARAPTLSPGHTVLEGYLRPGEPPLTDHGSYPKLIEQPQLTGPHPDWYQLNPRQT